MFNIRRLSCNIAIYILHDRSKAKVQGDLTGIYRGLISTVNPEFEAAAFITER